MRTVYNTYQETKTQGGEKPETMLGMLCINLSSI